MTTVVAIDQFLIKSYQDQVDAIFYHASGTRDWLERQVTGTSREHLLIVISLRGSLESLLINILSVI